MIGKDDALKMLDKVVSLGRGFDICAHLVSEGTLASLDMQEIKIHQNLRRKNHSLTVTSHCEKERKSVRLLLIC